MFKAIIYHSNLRIVRLQHVHMYLCNVIIIGLVIEIFKLQLLLQFPPLLTIVTITIRLIEYNIVIKSHHVSKIFIINSQLVSSFHTIFLFIVTSICTSKVSRKAKGLLRVHVSSLMSTYVEKQAKQFRNIRKMFLEHAW